jgi:hypothetical protein
VEVARFPWKAQERSGEVETPFRITRKEQSFAGRSPGVLDPERGIQGQEELKEAAERVAKP